MVSVENLSQPLKEALVSGPQTVGQQNTDRGRAFGGQIGKVYGDQLPRDIGWIFVCPDMNSLEQAVVGQDQCFAAEIQYGGVVIQVAGGGVRRQMAQRSDEGGLAAQRTSFATASRTPLTNLASRSSKKALATSTHSLIAAATGTSARAISS